MSESKYLFQYCQKIVILNQQLDQVLLARRKGEADYDGTHTFIGGKLETSDKDLILGLQREKNEEIGESVELLVLPNPTQNAFFIKNSGQHMVLPHYAAIFKSGKIKLSDEYSDYKWIPLSKLDKFEPKVSNIFDITIWAAALLKAHPSTEFIKI